jgi:hypothetical protein
MKDWRCTSKEEVTVEVEARSWDETIDNVCLRMAMCDHLLEFKTWRQDDPKPLWGISYPTTTRHLRILRKRLEKLMGRSTQKVGPPWSDLPRHQWELLCQGETLWKKYGEHIWDTGHKTVALFRGASKTPLHPTLWMTGDGIQTHHARVPKVKGVPASARGIIQEYLNMVDWRHIQTECPQGGTEDWYISPGFIQWREQQTTKTGPAPEVGELVRSLIYEPPGQSLTEGLEELDQGTSERGNSNIVATENSRGRTMGGGTIPTRSYTSVTRVTMGMGSTKPPSSRTTSTSVREIDSRLAPIPRAARQEIQLSMSFGGHLSRMWIIEMWYPKVRSFL